MNGMTLLKGRKMVYNDFKKGIFLQPNVSIVLVEPENSNSSEKSSIRALKRLP